MIINATLNITITIIALSSSLKYLVNYYLTILNGSGTFFFPIYGNPIGYNLSYYNGLRGIYLSAHPNSKYTINSVYYQSYIGNETTVQFQFIPSIFYKRLSISIYSPRSWFIINGTVSPPMYSFVTNGEEVGAKWIFLNQYPFQITNNTPYFLFEFSIGTKEVKNNFAPLFSTALLIIGIVSIIVIIAIVVRFIAGKQVSKRSNKYLISAYSLLSRDEREVLNKIKRDRYVWQDELQKEVSFSKAKLTKIIKKLESLKLIKVIRIGKYNKIRRR